MDFTIITILLLAVFVLVELFAGQVFISKKSGFPGRADKPREFWYHIAFHLIVIIILVSGYLFD